MPFEVIDVEKILLRNSDCLVHASNLYGTFIFLTPDKLYFLSAYSEK